MLIAFYSSFSNKQSCKNNYGTYMQDTTYQKSDSLPIKQECCLVEK